MGQLRKAEDVKQDGNLEGVRGSNNAAYGLIQKEEQLFEVEFLEIAPTPIIAYVTRFPGSPANLGPQPLQD